MLRLFRKKRRKKVVPEFNFSSIGVDMHSHIIPGIDDGAQNLSEALDLAAAFKDLGFTKLIATPHIMADYYRNKPDNIRRGLDILRNGIQDRNLGLEVDAAAEYYLDEALTQALSKNEVLTFGDGYLLFELSYINIPQNLFDTIKLIQDKGFKPVLAHPERYPYYYDSFETYQQIQDTGCLLQMNAIALTGYYGQGAKKTAEKMIENELVNFLGSDMHHLRHAKALHDSLNHPLMQGLLSQRRLYNTLL